MSGSFKVLVDKSSAIQRGSHKTAILPINKSHSDMVKFREGSEEDKLVARYIYELVTSLNVPLGLTKKGMMTQFYLSSLHNHHRHPLKYAKCLPRIGVSFDRQP